jgi:hypothetical protein
LTDSNGELGQITVEIGEELQLEVEHTVPDERGHFEEEVAASRLANSVERRQPKHL